MNTQQSQHNMKTIFCTVNKVIFHDQKSGKAILNAIRDNGKSCRLLGKIQNVAEGTILEAIGVWEQDEKYGWQFVAESIQESSQADVMQEFADDTMMRALDFSNILNQEVKDFRLLDLGYDEECQQSGIGQSDGTRKRKKKKASKHGFPTIKADDGATYNQKMTMLVSAPRKLSAFVIPDTVNCIYNNAFLNCGIKSITIPESVIVIGDRAFAGCKKLSSVTIPESVRNIGSHLFNGCSKLSSIHLTQDVNYMDGYVFYDCPELTSVDIPGRDVSIEYDVSSHSKYLKISKADVYKAKEKAMPKSAEFVTDKTVELDWMDVDFHYGYIRIPNQLGSYTIIQDDNVDKTIDSWRAYLSKMIPNLIVHFDHEGHLAIVNADDMHDAVITLRIKNDLSALIRSGYKTTEILREIDELKPKYRREFKPRDKSKYINFLLEQHAANKYPIVPVVEYIGGSKEEGTLYTIVIDEQPNIVWENNNDSRSSFIFRCTDEDYTETRQIVFDYIMAEETGKRKLLHKDECTMIFKEKPRIVVHNNINSWAQRLLCNPELIVDSEIVAKGRKRNLKRQQEGEFVTHMEEVGEKDEETNSIEETQKDLSEMVVPQELPDDDDLYDDDDYDVLLLTQNEFNLIKNIRIYVSFLVDFESYFADDEMWDEDGSSRELYDHGVKSLHADSVFRIKGSQFCEDDFNVYAGSKGNSSIVDSRDIYNPVDLPTIEIVQRSRFNGLDGIYERLCNVIESYGFDFAPCDSEVRVRIYNRGQKYTYDFSV